MGESGCRLGRGARLGVRLAPPLGFQSRSVVVGFVGLFFGGSAPLCSPARGSLLSLHSVCSGLYSALGWRKESIEPRPIVRPHPRAPPASVVQPFLFIHRGYRLAVAMPAICPPFARHLPSSALGWACRVSCTPCLMFGASWAFFGRFWCSCVLKTLKITNAVTPKTRQ